MIFFPLICFSKRTDEEKNRTHLFLALFWVGGGGDGINEKDIDDVLTPNSNKTKEERSDRSASTLRKKNEIQHGLGVCR